jgi:hypothetical protein
MKNSTTSAALAVAIVRPSASVGTSGSRRYERATVQTVSTSSAPKIPR